MIPKVHDPGSRTIGLLSYLYGPGKREEHIDPHLVASFDGLAPDPGRDPKATLKELQLLLDQPVQALAEHRRPKKHVWHCSVRADPGDRNLTDDDWADIARRIVAATGIDPGGGDVGCRWAAVRHADDHIHIIATLVREDGGRPDDFRSGKRAQAECRLIEADYGLTRVNAGDGTAAQRPTSAERYKAERHGRTQTPREELRETVRRAVAGAVSEAEFFDRLTAYGLLVKPRVAPSGDLLGYNVALPGDRNKDGEPIWYSGSRLAPDLSLPRIRARLTEGPRATTPGTGHDDEGVAHTASAAPSHARRNAASVAWDAIGVVDQGDDGAAAAQIAAAGEILDALAKTSAVTTRADLRAAAATYERAGRSHIRAQHREARALRHAARELIFAGPALGRGEDGAATAMVLDTLVFLTIAVARWHAQHHHAQQAAAARQAAAHLRAAYRTTAATPMSTLRDRGRRLARTAQTRHARAVNAALPEVAESILQEPGWYALAATLDEAERAGRDSMTLLQEAAAGRELNTATSVSDVLVWRMRRMANLPAPPPADQSATGRTKATAVSGHSAAASRPAEMPGR
ncbi:relaxase/mobilization nuclease domain-containing protein [Streptomyces phyllanthi]|uniref:Mobilization protein n=1 Tax=Streptomyces phyllanthi TaxID=1803180 RepID=A0A5N8VX73_9ACTN|nr:mobilization protein [Streptomyces phyllanthi]MPY38515.1 mobilization protein [Streptomyces phyllanthi]